MDAPKPRRLRCRCEKCGRTITLIAELRREPYGDRQIAYLGAEPARCPHHAGHYWLIPLSA